MKDEKCVICGSTLNVKRSIGVFREVTGEPLIGEWLCETCEEGIKRDSRQEQMNQELA